MTDQVADLFPASCDCIPVVFVNPAAGGGRAISYLPFIKDIFRKLQCHAEFLVTESKAAFEWQVRRVIADGRKLLLAMGGDGTFQALVNAAFGADVVLGIVPAGGGNDFAAALGLSGDPVAAAEAVLRGSVRSVDLARVCTADGQTRLYAGGGGVGLDAEAARYASGAYRRIRGRFRYVVSALRALPGYVPLEVQIHFPGSHLEGIKTKALIAGVLNTPTYGAGLRLAPDADITDGLFDIVLIEELGLFGALRLLPRLLGAGELHTSRMKRWRVPRVRFTTDRPSLFHGDGEILGSTPVEIEIVPRAVKVLAPPSVTANRTTTF